jgi:hypothetical protein
VDGRRKFRLEDVDGNVRGVAMLVTADLRLTHDAWPCHEVWVERPGDAADPDLMVRALWEELRRDREWSSHTASVLLNERARYLAAQRRRRELYGEESVQSPQEYWEEHAWRGEPPAMPRQYQDWVGAASEAGEPRR